MIEKMTTADMPRSESLWDSEHGEEQGLKRSQACAWREAKAARLRRLDAPQGHFLRDMPP